MAFRRRGAGLWPARAFRPKAGSDLAFGISEMILLLDDAVRVPPEATGDFAAFRRWTKSPEYPPRGEVEFLGKDVWVDLAAETLASYR